MIIFDRIDEQLDLSESRPTRKYWQGLGLIGIGEYRSVLNYAISQRQIRLIHVQNKFWDGFINVVCSIIQRFNFFRWIKS